MRLQRKTLLGIIGAIVIELIRHDEPRAARLVVKALLLLEANDAEVIDSRLGVSSRRAL